MFLAVFPSDYLEQSTLELLGTKALVTSYDNESVICHEQCFGVKIKEVVGRNDTSAIFTPLIAQLWSSGVHALHVAQGVPIIVDGIRSAVCAHACSCHTSMTVSKTG
jgi:hypothetical protein